MNSTINLSSTAARRIFYVVVAAVLMAAGLPFFNLGSASAAQLQNRSIYMSDSGVSGGSITSGVGSGAAVMYTVSFDSVAQASSMVIDFCAEDPIVNDNCTTPTGFSASSATLGATAVAGTVDTTNNWSITAATGRVKLADTGTSGDDIQAATPQSFELSGITNPSTLGTFYARFYTYANTTWGSYVSAINVGTYLDYGGVALSTTNTITITARVQEQLTFCVTKSDPATWTVPDCSDTSVASNPPALTLGHGSPTPVLDAQTVDTGTVWSQLSTNATAGASITMRNSNTVCGGLSADNGATCAIPANNSGAATASGMLVGSSGGAQFGMYAGPYAVGGMGTIGTVAGSAAYFASGHAPTDPTPYWGMDTVSTNNVKTVYGSTVASTAGPVYRACDQYTFAATAGLSTPAGIYTANLNLVATGTF